MTHFEIRSSRLQYSLYLVGAIGFVAGSVFILLNDGPAWVAWMGIVFFGAGMPLFVWQIIDRRPRLLMDDEGVLDRTLGLGKIPWKDIDGAFLKSIRGNDFVCLELKDADKYLNQLSSVKRLAAGANEKLGFTPISLNLSGVSASSEQVLELVLKMSEANNG